MVSISTDSTVPIRGKTGRQSAVFKDLPLKLMNQENIPQNLIFFPPPQKRISFDLAVETI